MNKDHIVNLLLVFFTCALVTVIIGKWVVKKPSPSSFPIDIATEKIVLTSTSGERVPLSTILRNNGRTYCFLFRLDDCEPCVSKHLTLIKAKQKHRMPILLIVVHPTLAEFQGWAQNYPELEFRFLSLDDYYRYVKVPLTPFEMILKSGKVESGNPVG